MRKLAISMIAAVCAVCLGTTPAKAVDETQPSTTTQSGGAEKVITREVSVEGTVEEINHATRDVTLKGPEGKTVTFKADPGVQRFDKIQKGDKVKVDYLESVTLSLVKEGEAPPPATDSVTVVPEGGEKPSGVAAETKQVMATVESVNGQEVTLRGPEGGTVTLTVSPEAAEKVKVGDKVVAQYTQAIAVDVTKP